MKQALQFSSFEGSFGAVSPKRFEEKRIMFDGLCIREKIFGQS